MIINAERDFGFVHIPKCAGSTIRQQLRDMDDLEGRFYRSMTHPELGRINAAHLPLKILAGYFPEELEHLRAVTSYTLVRDPMDRFISGVAQFVRGGGGQPGDMSADDARKTAFGIIDYMQINDGLTDYRHTLFVPQKAFITVDNDRVIDHVYPVEAINAMMDTIEARHGLTLTRDQVWNPTVTYRIPAMAGPLKRLKLMAQTALPTKTYAQLRDLGLAVLTTKGAPTLTDTLQAEDRVHRFVEQFYSDDIILYQNASAEFSVARSA